MNETRHEREMFVYDCDVIYGWNEYEGYKQPQTVWLEHWKHALTKGYDVINHYDTPYRRHL